MFVEQFLVKNFKRLKIIFSKISKFSRWFLERYPKIDWKIFPSRIPILILFIFIHRQLDLLSDRIGRNNLQISSAHIHPLLSRFKESKPINPRRGLTEHLRGEGSPLSTHLANSLRVALWVHYACATGITTAGYRILAGFPTEVALSSCIIGRGEPATGELFSRDISRGSGRGVGIIGRKNMREARFRSSLAWKGNILVICSRTCWKMCTIKYCVRLEIEVEVNARVRRKWLVDSNNSSSYRMKFRFR